NATRSCGRSLISGRWPISKGLWRTTLEPSTHPHLCTCRLLLLAEFGDGVLQRWGFFILAILRNMFPAVVSILVPAMTAGHGRGDECADVPMEQRAGRRLHQQVETVETADVRTGRDRAAETAIPGDGTLRDGR